jgi:hypothetical protein
MSFVNLHISDIDNFLQKNNIHCTDDKYLTVWNFIFNNPNAIIGTNIANWFTTFGSQHGGNITHYENPENYFKDLPNEVIAKIFLELEANDQLTMNLISKHFENVREEYLTHFLKICLKDEGIFVENVNSKQRLKDLYKSKHLNKKFHSEYSDEIHERIIGTDGKIYVTSYPPDSEQDDEDYDNISNIVIENFSYDISDIISISGDDEGEQLLLTNNGHVYGYSLNYDNHPSLLYESYTIPISNIVQILQTTYYSFFLASNGNVYKRQNDNFISVHQTKNTNDENTNNRDDKNTDDSESTDSRNEERIIYAEQIFVLKNVIEIICDDNRNSRNVLFLTDNGNVFKFNNDNITKIDVIKNIRKVSIRDDKIIALHKDKSVRLYNNKDFLKINFNSPANITKIILVGVSLWMLDSNHNLFLCNISDVKLKVKKVASDVINTYADTEIAFAVLANGHLISINTYKNNKIKDIHTTGKIQILDHQIVLVDNELYYVHDVTDGYYKVTGYRLIKIC